jgi:hypothetical protein
MDCLLAQAALVVTLSVRLLGIELAVERDGRIHDLIGPVTDLHQALQARDDFRFSFNQFRALARSRIHHLAEHRDHLLQLLVAEPLKPRCMLDLKFFSEPMYAAGCVFRHLFNGLTSIQAEVISQLADEVGAERSTRPFQGSASISKYFRGAVWRRKKIP